MSFDDWMLALHVLSAFALVAGIIAFWVIIVAAELGRRANVAYVEGVKKAQELQASGQTGPNTELLALNRNQNGVVLQAVITLVVLLVILDMIWKPGA